MKKNQTPKPNQTGNKVLVFPLLFFNYISRSGGNKRNYACLPKDTTLHSLVISKVKMLQEILLAVRSFKTTFRRICKPKLKQRLLHGSISGVSPLFLTSYFSDTCWNFHLKASASLGIFFFLKSFELERGKKFNTSYTNNTIIKLFSWTKASYGRFLDHLFTSFLRKYLQSAFMKSVTNLEWWYCFIKWNQTPPSTNIHKWR